MIDLYVGMPVVVNGHNAEILEFWAEPDSDKYVSVKVEYENDRQAWVPVKDLTFAIDNKAEITAIRPREFYHQHKHAGRVFPKGSGGRIIDRAHPARGSDIIVLGSELIEGIRSKPRTRYTVQVVEGPHIGETYSMSGDKDKLWLEEPLKPEVSEKEYEIAHPRVFSEPAQLTDIGYVELDLPPSYERILDEIFGEERDYAREFPTPKQLGKKLGLRTKTAKFYMDTIRKEMRDKGALPETEFVEEELVDDITEEAYLDFCGIEDEEEKD